MDVMDVMDMSLLDSWANNEFLHADLGDSRRTQRLIDLARTLGKNPSASLPEATEDSAQLKAAYRFFDNPHVEPDIILQSHIQATDERLESVDLVLAVQDTTYLDWTHHPQKQGMGSLASEYQQGLLAHTTLAMTPERVPMGILEQEVWSRDSETFGHKPDHHTRPIGEKESQKWLNSLDAVIAARLACPTTRFVSIGDAEADVFDFLVKDRPEGVDLLIRAGQNRCVEHEQHTLWERMPHATLAGNAQIDVPRRDGHPARLATVTVRYAPVTVKCPIKRRKEGLSDVDLWVVWAIEEDPPEGVEAVEWMLLTTVAVVMAKDAWERLEWYACRWGIEVFHKVLKSGCRIESRQLETAERLQNCLAMFAVIAWRIMYTTMLARAVPDAPCTAVLDQEEWQALYCAIHRTATVPSSPPTLRQAVRWIAQLGGFQGRTGDGEPGVTVMWKGFRHLADLTLMYHILAPSPGNASQRHGSRPHEQRR